MQWVPGGCILDRSTLFPTLPPLSPFLITVSYGTVSLHVLPPRYSASLWFRRSWMETSKIMRQQIVLCFLNCLSWPFKAWFSFLPVAPCPVTLSIWRANTHPQLLPDHFQRKSHEGNAEATRLPPTGLPPTGLHQPGSHIQCL